MHTLEEYASRVGADITGLVDAIRDLAWPMAEDVDVARLQRILEASRTCLVGEADALIDEARAILTEPIAAGPTPGFAYEGGATGPTPGLAYEGNTQFNATGSYYVDYGPTGYGYGVSPFQLRISEEVRRIEEAVRKEDFPTPDTLVIRVTDDMTLVFAPVAFKTHTIIDDDGAPVDYVKEGEPFMDGEGIVDYGIDRRWLSALTPTKTARGKEAETILENLTPDNTPIPISRLGRGRNPRQFYHSRYHTVGRYGPWPRRGQWST